MLIELARREKEANIKPDPDLDVFMKVKFYHLDDSALSFVHDHFVINKWMWHFVGVMIYFLCYDYSLQAISMEGQESNVITDYILKVFDYTLHHMLQMFAKTVEPLVCGKLARI